MLTQTPMNKSKKLSEELNDYLLRLFPLKRSITGAANRETLKILNEIVPINVKEYPSGSNVYDWKIPDEWHVKEAWIKDEHGNKLVDVSTNNVHILGYSSPIREKMSFDKLKNHLFFPII